MPDERIKVIFNRVFVKNDADWFGSGEFYFLATVDGQAVGDRTKIFDAREGEWINLPPATWSAEVDVAAKAQVVVRFQGMDDDVFWDDDLGTVAHTLKGPWRQRTSRIETEYFVLEWSVELAVDGHFGLHAPGEIFACRAASGSLTCTTVAGVPIVTRMEIHPVRPVPTTVMPPRDPFPPGTGPAVENNAGNVVNLGDPINTIPNPAVIPLLSAPAPAAGPAPALAAGAPPAADATSAARIEVTYYRPDTFAFTDNDPRLEWTARPLAGGAVAFLGPARGLKVMVYGTAAGEVLLEVRFRGVLFATYRALVAAVKQIPCRINILNGPNAASQPKTTPADAQAHLSFANYYLRQMAIALVLDTNVTVSDGAVATAVPGIFRISVKKGLTFHIDSDPVDVKATRLNYRRNVMNFTYVHSERRATIRGAATDFPPSTVAGVAGARPTVTDNGTPSDSWAIPTGILPDAAAGTLTMKLLNAIQRPGHPQLFAMFLADNTMGDPALLANQRFYARTMCHELGHILNLGHRVEGADPTQPSGLNADGIFWDNLSHPPTENIMYFSSVPERQDFDIIQARAARQSPLVPP